MADTSGAAEEANELKVQGNKAFAQHDWPKAIDYYTQAIEKNGSDPSFYCNRAQVREMASARVVPLPLTVTDIVQVNIKVEAYGYAVVDATKAIELDGSYIKVGLCLTGLV